MSRLQIENLSVRFGTGEPVVHQVSLTLHPGRMLALVGESGSGKSVTAHSILRLLPPQAHVSADSMTFEGRNLLTQTEQQLRGLRGGRGAIRLGALGVVAARLRTVAGQRHGREPVYPRAVDRVRDAGVLGGGRDHQHFVAPALQMLQDPQDGVRNPVHLRQE